MSINEKDFWLNELKEAPEKCSFPGIPAAGGTERNIDTLPFQLTGEVAAKLCAVANRSDVRMHIILVAALTALLEKYTGQKDIILGAPIYKQEIEGRFINTVLALRNRVQKEMTFKELLLQVSRTIKAAAENRNFPIEKLLYGLDIPYKKGDDFPLFDASLLLDNIHDREHLRQVHTGLVFIFSHKDGKVGGVVELDTRRYDVEGIERILGHLGNVLRQVLADVNTPLSQVGILSPEEESQLLEFNDTAAEFPVGKTIHGLFREQAGRTPDSIAVSAPVLAGDVHDLLLAGLLDADGLAKLDTCCFKKAAHLFQAPWQESQGGADKEKKGAENGALQNNEILFLLKTPRHNSVIVNRNLLNLLEMFNGECGLKGMFQLLKEKNIPFIAYTMSDIDLLEVTYSFEPEARVFYSSNYTEYVSLVQLLYSNHLIKFSGYTTTGSVGEQLRIPQFDNVRGKGEHNPIKGAVQLKAFGSAEPFSRKGVCPPEASVLLLGDTPGMASIGILYLASYLKRNGIDAVCRFDDTSRDYPSMKENIRELLAGLKPSVVAVSLKWFPYINRVLDMCRIIKEYGAEIGKDITVVVGGNTASYYWREVGVFDCIDYLIRGDGEEPLLGICKGDENIPNTVYLKNGEIIEEPMAYVQDDSHSPEIHLSHLDEIILSQKTPLLGTFFIYTHKGCAMNCFYCGGCNDAQRKAFNRKNVLRRGTEEVRKDIRAGKPYASTFQFDFDTYHRDLEGYCRDIWQGIDLSAHFCIITTLTPPSEELIKLVVETFKYVYWDFDVCTLSERHRQELLSKKMVKPLPTDAEIFQFFDRCEVYRNIEVRVNSITGLPYFTYEDIVLGEQLLTDIMSRYRSFGEMHWARLHAQPGAPISLDADAYDMHSYAVTYDDFYMHSRKNFREGGPAADMESLNYPYIYSMDDQLNSDISRSYFQANKRVEQNREKEERQAVTPVTLTYRQLDRESDSLAALLAANGVAPGSIVGLMAESSVDIPVGILGIMKAGCAYMPIDTTFPAGRIDFMLQDSKAAALVLGTGVQYVPPAGLPAGQGKAPPGPPMQDRSVLQPDIKRDGGMQGDLEHGTFLTLPARGNMEALENVPQYQEDPANNLAYVIYTSGTTGNPKGVLLTHQNLVNYVSWFSRFAQLKETDKTMLTSSFAFDLGYTSIYTSLLNGGELHVLPKDIYLVADRLLNYVKAKEITYIKMTPSLFSVIVNSPLFSKSMCASLRLAVIGGEAINLKDIELARELCDFIDIINHYGPTEATIGCIAKKIDFNHFQAYEAVPVIGRPIANTGVFILDKEANLLPIGVPGELCISGTCLAKGYLNRDVLNSEKFINIRQTQATVYRTGDLARLLPDGNIQFMGRIDNQVKIRGYRVELGEIENRMLKHKDVDEAAAIFHRDKDGDNYICAYYVPANQKEQKEVSSILSEKEHTRYKRQMLLEGWGTESQEKLKNTTVFVGGAGGGASPTVMALALAGFGKIIICDFDEVELSNLNRQFLHDPSRIGMNKALSAQMTVNTINPHIEVVPITEKLTSENVAQLVGDAAVIFDMFDGPASKFVLSRYASEKNIPHIISSMTDISSYTAVFHTPFTPCYHCVLDKKKLDELTAGMQSVSDTYQKQALAVVASSLMVSSGFAVNEAIKIVLGLRNPAYNKFLFFNQGGTDEIADSFGFKSMTTLFSDFFKKTCKEQGFDWETGWRGNFLEELDISVSPDCPICGKRSKDEENVAPPANNSTKKFSLADLKDYLAQELPEYMIPTYFVPLENMPLTPNGKIDKKALPEPDLSVQGDVIGPRNQLEEQLTSIWSDVLGRDKKTISMDADFFQMGGHSLKVTMLVEKIQSELKRDVPLSDIFKTPTIEKMTGLIAGKDSAASPKQADAQPVPPAALPGDQRAALPTPRGGALGTPMPVDPERKPGIVERGIPGEALEDENLVLLRKGEGKYNLFLMHAGGGEVTGYGEFCSRLNEQFNCWGLRAGHLENSTPVANTVEQIAAKYIRKMKIVQPQGPYFFKGWCFGGTIAFEMVRQLEANGEEIAFFSLVNSIPPRRRPGRFHEGITKFSLQSEKEYVSQFMSESIIEEVLTGVDDLADLWPTIIRYMDSIDYDPADIRKLIPDFMRDAILNFNELDCDKLIYYMNVVRSHLAARELYVPQTKVKKKSSFFTVTFGEIPDRDRWELYLEKDSTYLPVNGDHFSILRRPEVEDYAAAFDKLMMQHVDNG